MGHYKANCLGQQRQTSLFQTWKNSYSSRAELTLSSTINLTALWSRLTSPESQVPPATVQRAATDCSQVNLGCLKPACLPSRKVQTSTHLILGSHWVSLLR